MALLLSPAKLVLLAVHCAVNGDIDSLTTLAARHAAILRKDLLLRILLTYLPETLPSSHYVDFIQQLEHAALSDAPDRDIDCSPVEGLAEDDAVKKVRKLRLLPLAPPEAQEETSDDPVTLFLVRRSYKVDEEAGLLDELPALLLPFLHHSPCIRSLLLSTILPLMRRNCEYYPQEPISYTLQGFQQLPDRVAVNLLLSQTGVREADLSFVGRDLRGLASPWLCEDKRWKHRNHTTDSPGDPPSSEGAEDVCPGWNEVRCWLTTRASKNWKVAVNAIQQWDGPTDADLGGWGTPEAIARHRDYLRDTYLQAALASAYLIPEASFDALDGAYSVLAKIFHLFGLDPISPLASEPPELPALAEQIPDDIMIPKNAAYLRNDLLTPSNPLTSITDESAAFLQASILSAHILTKAGCPCTIRRAGELALLQDEREQKAEAAKLIHAMSSNGPKTDDKFWLEARRQVLWLRDWGTQDSWSCDGLPRGIFSQVKRDFLEVEILRALLSNTRYALARSIYEDAGDQPLDQPLDPKVLQDTIYATAMTAYDNASNPNRTRGGLKKCDDILKSFPKTIQKSDPQARRIEALLQATHSLSNYRLVLKQGEPFTPVVLRVHTDPISIVSKILEQNPKSYTHLHDLLALGARIVEAGLPATPSSPPTPPPPADAIRLTTTEHRITALCINAALTEDDFETAYSYVVNRLTNLPPSSSGDDHAWKAALQAGKYRRSTAQHHTSPAVPLPTRRTANADVRHLEQRIECLAAALRIAPPQTLQEIVNAFRRAEEELEVLLREEEAREDEWDARGDAMRGHGSVMPGGFGGGGGGGHAAARAPAAPSRPPRREKRSGGGGEEDAAPMSLFDLSRASVLSAQRNLSALSGLQRSASSSAKSVSGSLGRLAGGGGGDAGGRSSLDMPPLSATGSVGSAEGDEGGRRVRKRDQLREAAMGTLVSGVGWLVGAPAPQQPPGRE